MARPLVPANFEARAGSLIQEWALSGGGTFSYGGNGVVGSFSTAYYFYNGRSARLQATAPGKTSNVTNLGRTFNIKSEDTIQVALYVGSCTDNDSITVQFSSDNFATKSAYGTYTLKKNKTGYIYFTFRGAEMTLSGGELLSNTFTAFKVNLTSNASLTTPTDIYVLGAYQNARAQSKIIIEFDDGNDTQYSEAFSYMQTLGLVGNISVIYQRVGTAGCVTEANLQTLYDAGWDLTAHGDQNHTTLATYAAVLADVEANRDYLIGNGWTRGAHHYVYPGGIIVAGVSKEALAAAGMLSGRTVSTAGYYVTVPWGHDTLSACTGHDISANVTLAGVKTRIDNAVKAGASIRLYGHRIQAIVDGNIDITVADWQAICDHIKGYIDKGLLENVTWSQFYNGVSGDRTLAGTRVSV